MAFSLPSDLPTNVVDDVTTVNAAFYNNLSNMGNAVKAAIGTIGYGTQKSMTTASETTTSASYADLTTTTDQVTVAVGNGGMVLLFFGAHLTNSGANYCYIGVDISGANTTAASDSTCIQAAVHSAGVVKGYSNALLLTNLTPGFTTFKLKYKVNTGTGTFSNRRISCVPLPATDGTHAAGNFNLDLSSSVSITGAGVVEHRPIYDSTGVGSTGLGTTRSYTHTVGANAKAVVLYMNTSSASYSTTVAPSPTVTFGGQAMELLGRTYAFTDGSTWTWLCAYGLLNPPTGAQTVSVSLANSYTAVNSVAYTDVTGWGAATIKGTTTSTNPTITSPSATANKVITGALATYTQAMSAVTPNQRSIQNYANGYSYGLSIGDGDGPYGSTIACTAASGSYAGITVELMRTVPTYTKPTWVGTGVGVSHQTNPGASWVDTVPADANLALVWLSEQPSDQANTCTVTLGGTSMVEVTGSPWVHDFTSGWMRTRCFALQNPSTGPNKTIAITSNVSNYFHARSVYYGGTASIGPAVFTRGTSGSTLSATIPNSSSNHLYAQCFTYRAADNSSTFSAFSPSSGWRAVYDNTGGYSQPISIGDAYGNDGTLTISTTRSNATSNAFGSITLDLSPAALPTPSTPTFVGLGAGRPHVSGSTSWLETVPTNANCAMLFVSSLGNTAVSATLGGTAMTTVTGSPFTYYSGNYSIQVLYLLNPPTGSRTLALTNTNGNNVHCVVTYYGGVTTIANPTAVSTGAAAQQPQIAVSNTESNHAYVNAMAFRPAAAWDSITGYDQNRRIDHPNYSYDTPILVGDAVGNGGTLTFNGTRNNTSYEWGGVAVDLSPTGRAASFNVSVTSAVGFTARSSNAVTFDSVGAGFSNAAATSPSWSHTIGANAKGLIVAATFYNNGLASPTFTNAKVGTKDLALLGKFLNYTTGGWNTYTAYLGCVNPPTGTQTVTFTTGSAYIGAQSFAYNNVGTILDSVQTSTANVSTGPTDTITVATPTTSDDMIFGTVSGYTTTFASFSPNQRYNGPASLYWIAGDSIGNVNGVTMTAVCNAATLFGAGYVIMKAIPVVSQASFSVDVTSAISMTAKGTQPTIQGSNAARSTSVTIPTHAAGDLIVIHAKGLTTAVSKPSASGTVPAWVDIDSANGSYTSTYTAYFIATADNHTSGTWTNAKTMVATVIRGHNSSNPIGGHALGSAGATGNTCTGTAITLTNTTGSSQILEYYAWGDGVNSVTSAAAAPSGHTRQVTGTWAGSAGDIVVMNTKNDTTSDGAVAHTSTTGSWWRSATIEILSAGQ